LSFRSDLPTLLNFHTTDSALVIAFLLSKGKNYCTILIEERGNIPTTWCTITMKK
jgi:hypothetical protein